MFNSFMSEVFVSCIYVIVYIETISRLRWEHRRDLRQKDHEYLVQKRRLTEQINTQQEKITELSEEIKYLCGLIDEMEGNDWHVVTELATTKKENELLQQCVRNEKWR